MDAKEGTRRARIGFVGGGNMAEALVRGIVASGVAAPDDLYVSEPRQERSRELSEAYGVGSCEDNGALAEQCEIVVLAVKPAVVPTVLRAMRDRLDPEALVVSICAGVRTGDIEAELGDGARVVRAMPNTAAMALAGATAIAAGAMAKDDDLQFVQRLFEAVGCCVVVPETLLDAVTGLSGSGPAYVMLVIEALADGGVQAGLSRDVAQLLAAQTVYGAAKLQRETGESPASLRDRVSSPGGTTIAGLAELEARGVRGAFVAAVQAATDRSSELGRTS